MKRVRGRLRRHLRGRKKMLGTAKRPRMVIYRSLKNLYVQLINDIDKNTIISYSTNIPEFKKTAKYGGNVKAAGLLGEFVAKEAVGKGIKEVLFDRSGYMFHGRVKSFADSALKNGLSFGGRTGKKENKER